VEWIDLALERNMRWAIVNMSVNLGALFNTENLFSGLGTITFF